MPIFDKSGKVPTGAALGRFVNLLIPNPGGGSKAESSKNFRGSKIRWGRRKFREVKLPYTRKNSVKIP